MTTPEPGQTLAWGKARRCDTNTCVEVAGDPSTYTVFVRNSQAPDGPVVAFPAEDWDEFRNELIQGRHQITAWEKIDMGD